MQEGDALLAVTAVRECANAMLALALEAASPATLTCLAQEGGLPPRSLARNRACAVRAPGGGLGRMRRKATGRRSTAQATSRRAKRRPKNQGGGWLVRPLWTTGLLLARLSLGLPAPITERSPSSGAGQVAMTSFASHAMPTWSLQEGARSNRRKRHATNIPSHYALDG
jgi:hypothetical protein